MSRRLRLIRPAIAAAVLFPLACVADEPADDPAPIALVAGEQSPKDHLRASVFLSADRLTAGGTCKIAVVLDVEKGWHVNTNPAQPAFLTPTKVTVKSSHGTKLAELDYPQGKAVKLEGSDEPQTCYEGRALLVGTLQVPAEAAGKTEELQVEVKFQACNDTECLPPKSAKLTGKVAVAAHGEAVKPMNEMLFAEAAKIAQKKPAERK